MSTPTKCSIALALLAFSGWGHAGTPAVCRFFPRWYVSDPLSSAELIALRIQAQPATYTVEFSEVGAQLIVTRLSPRSESVLRTRSDLLEDLRHAGVVDEEYVLDWKKLSFVAIDGGHVLSLPAGKRGLIFLPQGGQVPVKLSPDIAVSSIVKTPDYIVVCEAVESPLGEERGSMLLLDCAQTPPVLKHRLTLPYAVLAAGCAPDGSLLALTRSSILRVDVSGRFRVLYGAVGFSTSAHNRLSWSKTHPTSVAQIGDDYVIGTDFGAIWVTWAGETQAYRENWLFPPDLMPILMEVKGIQQFGQP